MIGELSDFLIGKFLTATKDNAKYVGLHTDFPSLTDPLATECSGPSYRRQKVEWKQTGRVLSNTKKITFTGLPVPSSYVAVVLYPSATSTTWLGVGLLSNRFTLTTKQTYSLPIGALTVRFD